MVEVIEVNSDSAVVELSNEEIRHINTYLQGRDETPPGGARVGQVLSSEFRDIEDNM